MMAQRYNTTIKIDVEQFRTKKQQKLLAMLNDKNVKVHINTIIKDAINPFVPMKTGALRESAAVFPNYISWGKNSKYNLKYAHYQYMGIVYGPNFPIADNGAPAWRSPKGKGSKHPTEREIGAFKGTLRLYPRYSIGTPVKGPLVYNFGYTTRGTHHHWDRYFRYLPKLNANLKITRYLKTECKRRGLKV